MTHSKKGDHNRAVADLREAVRLEPGFAQAKSAFAELEPAPPRIPAASGEAGAFTFHSDHDLPGGDLGSPLKEVYYPDCLSACSTDRRCVAFTYNKRHRWCFLKSTVARLKSHPEALSAIRTDIQAPKQELQNDLAPH